MIRLVEGDSPTRAPITARLEAFIGVPRSLVTSRLTRLECRSKPLRERDIVTLRQFDTFFAGKELAVVEIGPAIIERATELRARYGLKSPDALHYASALEAGATVFLTGDHAFARCTEIHVELL